MASLYKKLFACLPGTSANDLEVVGAEIGVSGVTPLKCDQSKWAPEKTKIAPAVSIPAHHHKDHGVMICVSSPIMIAAARPKRSRMRLPLTPPA